MATRIKPDPHVVEDTKQAEGALAEIAALDRKLEAISSAMQESIDAAKAKASQEASPLQARRKELADAVAVFARLNRTALFVGAKSIDLGFGIIGFRASSKLIQVKGVTAATTLERLHQFNFTDGIRVKEEINKEAIIDWPAERLELLGLKKMKTDTFYIEIKRDVLPKEGAA